MAVGVGTGTTLSFAGSNEFTAEITGFNLDGRELPVIDVSALSDTGFRKKISGKLEEPGQLSVEINFDPSDPPSVGDKGAITVTWPDATTLTGSGFVQSFSVNTPLEDKMTATFTFQFDGFTGPAFS